MERSDKNLEQVVKEVFFAGEHGCIGGGTEEYRGLSDYTLQWIIHEAKKLGLEFDSTEDYSEEFWIKPEPTTKFDNSVTGVYALAGEGWRPIESSKVADRGTSKLKSLCSMEYRYRLQKKISHTYHI
ncbi:MAG: phospholipase effector Tle1 domain-containing protein, partial [Microcystis aeruginosa]